MLSVIYRNPDPYEAFAEELLRMEVDRIGYDAVANQMAFYSQDCCVHSLVRKDIEVDRIKSKWKLGSALNIEQIERTNADLDKGKMTPVEFHRAEYEAGVINCQCYLVHHMVVYIGNNGQTYLEEY